jgi:large conductance mechanosensitive channel
MGMVSEFKEFAMKGSMIDMAVGIIIGAATGKVVSALVDSVIMPVVGVLMGGVDFSNLSIKVGEAAIGYGAFIQAIIDFVIIAFVIFMLLKFINNLKNSADDGDADKQKSEDTELLREIRDLLQHQRG